MTVQEARKSLEILEEEIQSLIKRFEEETDMEVHNIYVDRIDTRTFSDSHSESMLNRIEITAQL